MIDLAFENKLPLTSGSILLADPFEGDEYFERSVVFLCEHAKEGSFGFILNQPLSINLGEINEEFTSLNLPLSSGGPVDKDRLFFIHTLGESLNQSQHLTKGIYIGSDFEQLYQKLRANEIQEHEVRFFVGYAGWTKNQLQEEVNENAWVVTELNDPAEIMQTNADNSWNYFMNRLGGKFKIMTNFPINPTNN